MFKIVRRQSLVQMPGDDIVYSKIEITKYLFGIKIFHGQSLEQVYENENNNERTPIHGFSFGNNIIRVGDD